MLRALYWFEVTEHLLKFRQIGRRLITTHRLETLPQIEDGRICVGSGDGLLRNPFEDFNDGSILRTHHDRGTVGNETLGSQRRKMVPHQLMQSFLATRFRFVTGDGNRPHTNTPMFPRSISWRGFWSSCYFNGVIHSSVLVGGPAWVEARRQTRPT